MGWLDSLFGRPNHGGEGHNAARSVAPQSTEGANFHDVANANVRAPQSTAGRDLRATENFQNTGDNTARSTTANHVSNVNNVTVNQGGQANERTHFDPQSQVAYGQGPSENPAPSNKPDELAAVLEIEYLKWDLRKSDSQKEILRKEKREFEEENRQLKQSLSASREENRRLKEMLERYEEQERIARVHQILRSRSPSVQDSTGVIVDYVLQFKTMVNMDRNFNLPG